MVIKFPRPKTNNFTSATCDVPNVCWFQLLIYFKSVLYDCYKNIFGFWTVTENVLLGWEIEKGIFLLFSNIL